MVTVVRYAIYLRQSLARDGSVSVEFQETDCRAAVAQRQGRPRSRHRRDHVWIDLVGRCRCGRRLYANGVYKTWRKGGTPYRGVQYYVCCSTWNGRGRGYGCVEGKRLSLRRVQASALRQLREQAEAWGKEEDVRDMAARVNAERMTAEDERTPLLRQRTTIEGKIQNLIEACEARALRWEQVRARREELEGELAKVDAQLAQAGGVTLINVDTVVAALSDTAWLAWAETDVERFADALRDLPDLRITVPGADGYCDVTLFSH